MANYDEFLKILRGMDRRQLQTMVQNATANMTPEQREKLKLILSDPAKIEAMKSKINDRDLQTLRDTVVNPDALSDIAGRADIQKRIDELL